MSWEIPAPTADAARSEARWSFYDLLDDYKQVLETNPVAAGTNAVSEPPNTRRVQSAPPLGEPAPIASAPLARSSSANPIDRRVRFAGDGLVRIHHFVPIPASNDAGEVTGVLPVTEEDDGADADDEDADEADSDERPSTSLSDWIKHQRAIRSTPPAFSYLSPTQHGGLGVDLPFIPTPPASSAGNTLRSSASWGGTLPLTPNLSRSPDPEHDPSHDARIASDAFPGTPLPDNAVASPVPPSKLQPGEHRTDKPGQQVHQTPSPKARSRDQYEIRRYAHGKGYRWSIDKYTFPQVLDYEVTDMRARYSYFSPVSSDGEDDDADEDDEGESADIAHPLECENEEVDSDSEVGRIAKAQCARVSIATVVSPSPSLLHFGSPLSTSSSVLSPTLPTSPVMPTSPFASIHRSKALRIKRRHIGTNTLPRSYIYTARKTATMDERTPHAAPAADRRATADADCGVFAIMQRDKAVMQGAALVAAERRRRRTMSAPRSTCY